MLTFKLHCICTVQLYKYSIFMLFLCMLALVSRSLHLFLNFIAKHEEMRDGLCLLHGDVVIIST